MVPLDATRHKLSRFPSTLEIFAGHRESLPSSCVILGTGGHSCCMPPFTMPKYLADNRIVVVAFLVLTFVNAFAIQNNWY